MSNVQRSAVIGILPLITAQAYSAAQQLGTATRIPSAVKDVGGGATLMSLAIVDKANQKSALDILLFNAQPTLISTDGTTLNISDAELTSKYLGRVVVPNTNYKSNSTTNADVSVGNIILKVQATSGSLDIWCVVVCQGSPTYTSTSDLVLSFGFNQD